MRVVASIDLMGAQAVQLVNGRPDQPRVRRSDCFELAREFSQLGPINVIDLDAALGLGSNAPMIEQLAQVAPIYVGGGLRTVDDVERVLAMGAVKAIVGTPLYTPSGLNHPFLDELGRAIGRERLVFAADCKAGMICVHGWQHSTQLGLFEVVPSLGEHCSELLFTCVDREGLLGGPDMAAVRCLTELSPVPILAAGGIGSIEDVRALLAMGASPVLGMSLYTGRITLQQLREVL